jgi:WD40 repeat protein
VVPLNLSFGNDIVEENLLRDSKRKNNTRLVDAVDLWKSEDIVSERNREIVKLDVTFSFFLSSLCNFETMADLVARGGVYVHTAPLVTCKVSKYSSCCCCVLFALYVGVVVMETARPRMRVLFILFYFILNCILFFVYFDLQYSRCLRVFFFFFFSVQGHREWIWSVACSPSGLLCSGSQDKLVIAWNPVSFLYYFQGFFFFFFK